MTTKIAGFEIRVNGSPLDQKYARGILELRVEQNLALPDVFLARVGDPGLHNIDEIPFEVGGNVEVLFEAPDEHRLKRVFVGQIAVVEPEFDEHGVVLAARGYDASYRLHRSASTETYQNMTYGDIASKVISRAGLQTGTIDSAAGVHDFVQQSGESDWDFLSRLARRIDFELVAQDGKIHFRKTAGAGGATELKWGDNLLAFRPRVTGAQQIDGVVVRGWDPKTKQAIEASANRGEVGSKLGIDHVRLASALGNGSVKLTDREVASDEEAQALADGTLSRLANAYVDAEGCCHGNPSVRAGTIVKINGVGKRFGGTYRLSAASHVYRGGKGYETRFKVAGRSSGSIADVFEGRRRTREWGTHLVTALVTNNDDPDKLGRVRVKFPALGNDVESWWAPLLAPNAGADRGLLMMPQVDDEVLVGFEQGDVRFPYVLGSVWNGSDKPGDLVATDGSFVLESDEEIRLRSKGNVTISSQEDLSIETDGRIEQKASSEYIVQGRSVTVKANSSVSIEASADLTIKGGSSVSIQAQGNLTLQASGVVQVSGSQIMLG